MDKDKHKGEKTMIKALVTTACLMVAMAAGAADLTGTWQGDDGGTYYLRQSGSELHWYGEAAGNPPRWSNVFDGRISGNGVRGRWYDVPKGQTLGAGELALTVTAGGNVLEANRKTGGFGGSRWVRAGYQPQAVETKPMAPMAPAARVQPMPAASEDCISFDPDRVLVSQAQGRWKIVDGQHWMFDFGSNRDQARAAFRVIRHYRLNQSCFVGRPNPSLRYLLSNGKAPVGALRGEDCIGFDPQRIAVSQVGGHWKIVDGSHWMFDFGSKRQEAEQALTLIRRYGFTQSCFVGRPNPSFSYLRQ